MKDLTTLANDIAQARKGMQTLNENLPRIMGVESVKIVKYNFDIEGYDSGNGITQWAKRKAATNAAYDRGRSKITRGANTGKLSKYRSGKNSTFKGSVYSSAKPLLRQTLTLFNGIHYRVSGRRVFIGVDLGLVPYARAHNEGLNHEPRRQYMPYGSQRANPKILGVIKKRIDYEQGKVMRVFKK